MNDENIKKYPAPWDLHGTGYIMLYKFSKDFVKKHGCIPDFLRGRFAGGFGAVMLVNYESSNAGPYGELLFIPGKFDFREKRLNNISKIYVSTMESVVNGRANWGIPKEKADFKFTPSGLNSENIVVSTEGRTIAAFEIETGKAFFPVSTSLLPFPLVQKHEGKYLYTDFFGKGIGRLARIKRIHIDRELFPDISKCRPIAVIQVDPFDITFPVSKVTE